MTLYRMLDAPGVSKAAIVVDNLDDADHWNAPEYQFGIFATVNTFEGARRKENLRRVAAWAVDIDEGPKADQAKRIQNAPLLPSLVVETKRGYQAHWFAKDGIAAHWDALVLERLVPYFGADRNARDLCRILRVPGFWHWKDPSDPFLIRRAFQLDVSYTERQIADAFPWKASREKHQEQLVDAQRRAQIEAREKQRQADIAMGRVPTQSLWDAIYALDQREVLERLSGTAVVNGEVYAFQRTSRHRNNILVDGKGGSCFVDENGRIGSLDGGGPTIVQWCKWLGKGYAEILDAVKRAFPHLAELDEANRKAWRAA